MAYGIKLVHQNPRFKHHDDAQPLWWQGPIEKDVRSDEWDSLLPRTQEGRFLSAEEAQRRAIAMAPYVSAEVAPLP